MLYQNQSASSTCRVCPTTEHIENYLKIYYQCELSY